MTSHHLLLKVETLSVEKLPVNWRTYRISFGRQPKWKNSRLLQSRLSQSLPVWSSQLNRHRRPLSRWIYLNWDNLPKIKNNKKQLDSKSKSLMLIKLVKFSLSPREIPSMVDNIWVAITYHKMKTRHNKSFRWKEKDARYKTFRYLNFLILRKYCD